MFLRFLASLSKLHPSWTPSSSRSPDRHRLCALRADTQRLTPSMVPSASLGTDIGFCVSYLLSCPRKTTPLWVPGALLAWKEGAGGVRGRRLGDSSLLQLLWLSPGQEQWWLVLRPAQPSARMLTVKPCLLCAWPRFSASLSLLMKPWGPRAGIGCSLVSGE